MIISYLDSLDENIDITSSSSFSIITYNKETYYVFPHHDNSIIRSELKNNNLELYQYSKWNELIIYKELKNINLINRKKFKSFNSRIPNNIFTYFVNNYNTKIKFIEVTFLPLKMLPDYPYLIYYKFKMQKNYECNSGDPVFDYNNNLIGIISKQENKYCYVIPSIYIIKIFSKQNDIYLPNIESTKNITYIERYKIKKVKMSMIFYRPIGINIPLSAYFLIEGDINKHVNITENNIKKRIFYTQYNNFKFKITNKIILNENKIKVTTAFLSYLYITNNIELLRNIIMNDKKPKNLTIDDKVYHLVF